MFAVVNAYLRSSVPSVATGRRCGTIRATTAFPGRPTRRRKLMRIASRRAAALLAASTLILFSACGDADETADDDAQGAGEATEDLTPSDGTILFGRLDGNTERYLTIAPDGADEHQVFEAELCRPCAFLSPDGSLVMTPAVTADDRLTTA